MIIKTLEPLFMNKLIFILALFCGAAHSAQLDEKLAVFEPYLGTWEANFSNDPAKPVIDVGKWERALNGTAIRTLHSINQGEYGGESLIFWDKAKQKLVFYYFTTAGFYTHGELEVTSATEFVAYEEVTGNENGITRVKSTSSFKNDSWEISTSYLKNNQWTQPESRTYRKSDKQVIFK